MKVVLNPDTEVVERVREGIKKAGGHCPCIIEDFWGPDTKCPCKVFRETKDCHCTLYVKIDS